MPYKKRSYYKHEEAKARDQVQAIINAKVKDSQPGEQHYFPALKETKVYELGEALMERIGKNRWQEFISKSVAVRTKTQWRGSYYTEHTSDSMHA